MTEIYKSFYAQKATKLDLIKHKNLEGWYVTTKYDGIGSITTLNDTAEMFAISKAKVSGQFTNFSNKVPHLIDELNKFDFKGHLHGEIISTNFKTLEENFGYTVGTLHADDAIERQEKSGYLSYVIYDIPSHTGIYEERYKALQDLFNKTPELKYISLMPILGININNSWMEIFNNIIENDGEGCILYNPKNVYRKSDSSNLRNSGVLKCKATNQKEVLCIELIEGKDTDKGSKYKNSLGSMLCVDERGCKFNVGSFNITDEYRKELWDTLETPCIIEIIFYQKTTDSYKLPRFKRVRLDKSIDEWNPE